MNVKLKICGQCNVVQDATVKHCHDCDVCIRELDHHCPWMGKCIGKRNLWAFYSFEALIAISAIYMAAWVIIHVLEHAAA